MKALHAVHTPRFEGLEHLPHGPALLVGNHGLLGYETVLFFDRLFEMTGRMPRGLADRWFFRVPGVRDALVRLGGMYGNVENALHALGRDHLVVCYPGGAREVLKRNPGDCYRLRWEKSLGFVKVALKAGVPIIPFAAAGVDDTYHILSRIEGSGRYLMGNDKYDLPLLWGRGPLPEAVPFWFRIGKPIQATCKEGDEVGTRALHREVWAQTQSLLDGLVGEWREARGMKGTKDEGALRCAS
ncbi:putative acyltransferase [Chondromyces apiculatus DSM 436]|uniref:Putative acyltransferase n=1 Tax=Chondromyces apiculatus DSM 436 TaxID=1192034 RepID=A0A017SYX0_9BACT|nr:putative acyltransferase [Chondromyces apiculatus DSM 436]